MTWKFILWYYRQMEVVYVSSRNSADELTAKGIPARNIRLIPRGIDTESFHPSKRNGYLARRYGIRDKVCLLYVGRVSREKNLPVLAAAYKELAGMLDSVHLVIVGDGPYMEEMRRSLRETPCTFTGYLEGEALSNVYASADLFVFPSTTDTFGNVVLEAQASGLPVIVTDQGGPSENVIPGETGLVVGGGDVRGLAGAMRLLVTGVSKRKAMGKAARRYMEDRCFEAAFIRSWKLYEALGRPEGRYAKSA
jgi:glycosyltransferase involved in cell wall biosynthesis